MSDTMTAMRARWINTRVAWNHRNTTGTVTRRTGTVVDMTPAELLVEDHETGARTWITTEVDGFEGLQDRTLDLADYTEPREWFAEGDAVSWDAYYGGATAYGYIASLEDGDAAIVRDMDGHTFRVALDRVARRTPDATTTFAGAKRGTGVSVRRDARGLEVTAFDNNRAEGGTEPAVRLSFGTAQELAVWLHDQMTNPANDYSATR